MGESPILLWSWEETHIMKVVSSNPSTIYRMELFTLICSKKIMFVSKRPKINEKNHFSRTTDTLLHRVRIYLIKGHSPFTDQRTT